MNIIKHVGELVKGYVSAVQTVNERFEADVHVLEMMRLEDVYRNLVDARLRIVREGLEQVENIYKAKGWNY